MRRDLVPPDGEDDPLDVALGDVHDLDELELRFALLDERLATDDATAGLTGTDAASIDVTHDDPFVDIARVLREQRFLLDGQDADEDSLVVSRDDEDDVRHASNVIDDDDDDSDLMDEPETDAESAEIESICQDALDLLDSGSTRDARDTALAAVRIDDEHPFPMFVLGLVAEREGDLALARDMAELSLRTAGTNPDAIGLRAHIHVRQHEFADAEQLLRFGIAHNPDEAPLHEGLARVQLARGEHERALRSAAVALKIDPSNSGALAVRAAALDEGRDRHAMLATLRQGVLLHPADPYTMVELAAAEMEHGNVDRARMLLMRAHRLAPHDGEISDVRALVEHVHEHRLLRAIPRLLRWIKEFPGGLAGFVAGLLVASLPLHALAADDPTYRASAYLLIGAWAATALAAWMAPALLARALDRRAARAGAARLADQLRDPLAEPPTLQRLGDVVSMLASAHDRRGALALLDLSIARSRAANMSVTSPHDAAIGADVSLPLTVLTRRLRSRRSRLRSAVLAIPALDRALVAIAVTSIIIPTVLLARQGAAFGFEWYAAALGALAAAAMVSRSAKTAAREVDDAFTAMRISSAAAGTSPRGTSPRGS